MAKAWMETAFSKMGDKMPDSFTIHLPCYRTLYAYMAEDQTIAGENELIAYSQFCKLMHTDFNQVTISEMNITGRLPEAGNLKLTITRLLPEKTFAAI